MRDVRGESAPATGDLELDEGELRTLLAVGRALVAELDLDTVLRTLLDTARRLTGARYAAVGVLDADKARLARFVFVGIDEERRRTIGPLPRGHGVLGELIRNPEPLMLHDVTDHPRSYGFPAGHPPMRTFLGVPIRIHGEVFGNLYLAEKDGGADFDAHDRDSVIVLADWAAIAIDNARSVEAERLRSAIEASEQERRRWARELHDETLQELGALKVMLQSAERAGSADALGTTLAQATEQIDLSIKNLQSLITELRPAALDELGLVPALETLIARTGTTSGLEIDVTLSLAFEEGRARKRLSPQIESAAYRLVQESLTNVAKHARAERVALSVCERGDWIEIEVRDDGAGFDPAARHEGFGLLGMRERIVLVGGELEVRSEPGAGTVVRARVPAEHGRGDA